MARQRANPPPPKEMLPQRTWVLIAFGVLALLIVLFVAYSGGDDDEPTGRGTCVPVETFPDVHGLAVAPDNSSRLYVATHHGLIRATNDTDWCRLGPIADYMGFTAHPTDGDVFWVSGHPQGGGNMGVRQTTDGGHTWETLALEGVDFHAMTVARADPDRLWGTFRGEVYRSLDGGHDWDIIGDAPDTFLAMTSHPTDRDIVYGVGQEGIHASGDSGLNWILAFDRPTRAFAIHPEDPNTMLAVFEDGLHRSRGSAANWEPLDLQVQGTLGHIAFSPSEPDTIYVATYQGGIHKSTDGGDSWEQVK